MVARSMVRPVRALGSHGRRDRDGQEGAEGAHDDAVVAALEREIPEARFGDPSGGYPMWVELPEGVDVAELEKAAAEREVLFVKGTDFLLEGGHEHAAPGLLRRDARADRRGITGLPKPSAHLASRHSYGADPSQYGELYGEGPVAVLIHGGFWRDRYD